MNAAKYDKHIDALTEDELKQAVKDFKTFDETDILEVGVLRRLLDTLKQEGEDPVDAVGVCRYGIYQRVAHLWAGV